MELTGHTFTEAVSGTEEAGTRERTEGKAGGARLERRVRPLLGVLDYTFSLWCSENMNRFEPCFHEARPGCYGQFSATQSVAVATFGINV